MSMESAASSSDPVLAGRLARFFRTDADPWERLEVALPPQVFGRASTREFARYLEGVSRVQVRSVAEVCAWLRACERQDDASLFFEADYWQHPVTFEQFRKGDCEDHALWAWRQLRQLGYRTQFVAGLWRKTPHAWVVWNDGEADHLYETTAKIGPMERPLGHHQTEYCPALAVDEQLRTYVYQGYLQFHAAQRQRSIAAGPDRFEVAILAGGRSTRMGRDKARIRIRGRSLLGWAKQAAAPLGHPIRVVRRDRVPACGPMGGVLTALEQARSAADVVVFLSCDMPAVTPDLLTRITRAIGPRTRAVFAEFGGQIGFPFAVRTTALEAVRRLHAGGGRSLRRLAESLRARRLRVPLRDGTSLRNLNTPGDLAAFRRALPGRSVRRQAP